MLVSTITKLHIAKWMISTAVAMVGLVVLTYVQPLVSADTPIILGFEEYQSIDAEGLIKLTNQVRVSQGLNELEVDEKLNQAALAKAVDMRDKAYFEHFRPSDQKSPWKFMDESGYQWQSAGENLARGFKTNNQVMEAWLASPTHKQNILNKRYEEVGIATVMGEKNGLPVVITIQMFGAE